MANKGQKESLALFVPLRKLNRKGHHDAGPEGMGGAAV